MYNYKLYFIETKGVQQHASLKFIRKHVEYNAFDNIFDHIFTCSF